MLEKLRSIYGMVLIRRANYVGKVDVFILHGLNRETELH